METLIKIGISSCLLGNNVRYDGGHKLDRFLRDTFGKFAEYIPVCPESECGLGIPREAMRLEGDPQNPRLITIKNRKDITGKMKLWSMKRANELEKEELRGFIFKCRSPSCGMERVKVYNEKETPIQKGTGLFAKEFITHFPLIPVEEEGRLHDPLLRENFIERIFTLKRWRDLTKGKLSIGKLVEFHTRNKLLLLAHSEKHYRLIGKMVAQTEKISVNESFREYEKNMIEALKLKATPSKNKNVLQHMMGYFKKVLSPDEKQELLGVIDEYATGNVPLIVPITLINHYVRKYDQVYLKHQTYLNPNLLELKLRNHV
ncbi:YbgA family protein [Thermodesulfobacteriota bacterium]